MSTRQSFYGKWTHAWPQTLAPAAPLVHPNDNNYCIIVISFVHKRNNNKKTRRFGAGFCFTVVYGALLTKTNRISRIFRHGKQSAKRPSFISPRSQLVICAALVFVQVSMVLAQMGRLAVYLIFQHLPNGIAFWPIPTLFPSPPHQMLFIATINRAARCRWMAQRQRWPVAHANFTPLIIQYVPGRLLTTAVGLMTNDRTAARDRVGAAYGRTRFGHLLVAAQSVTRCNTGP